ncbi:DEAD/DEAH box helicase [Candidatus Woesearchaeota archaeon]|nr:DEAD/DEAH box helicase [Candidatus Woesearchaeota archaeon]
MIGYLKSKADNEDVFKVINPVVGSWFKSKFKGFSDPQRYAIIPIHNKENILVSAVTGSGKTLTAFTSILSELITLSENDLLENQIYAVYISPLKALSNDIHFNLEQPLKEMEAESKKDFNIKVAVRTGDTTQSEKSKMLRRSPHILITTPESFSIVLTSPKLREKLSSIKWVIIDEIHALAESKRGVHLSLALERLEELSPNFTRIGLSATAEPVDEIAQFLVGNNRDCKIAKVDLKKKMDIKVLSPTPDLINVTYNKMHEDMYILIDNLIQAHKTTLIFTNTRSATERVVHHLKEKFPKKYTENIGAHHGSLSKEHRLNMEKMMREGKLKAIVCSTSLELGIDIGYIDLVILLGSPKSVARCTQRFGRAGHRLHDTIKGRIIVLDRDDLVECSILLKDVIEGKIDRIHLPENCLDVLAQQIYGIAITGKISEKDLWKMVTGSYCYRNLKYSQFIEVLDYLSGEYTKLEDRYVYAKIWYDKETGMIGKEKQISKNDLHD